MHVNGPMMATGKSCDLRDDFSTPLYIFIQMHKSNFDHNFINIMVVSSYDIKVSILNSEINTLAMINFLPLILLLIIVMACPINSLTMTSH